MLIIIISRSSLKLDHVGSKTRLLGHQATQVSDLGPLWPSCFCYSPQFTMQNRGTCCLKKYFNMERSKGNFVRKNLKK